MPRQIPHREPARRLEVDKAVTVEVIVAYQTGHPQFYELLRRAAARAGRRRRGLG
jgi:hypothetical protein